MKTIVINADPKRKGINAQLMKSALKGADEDIRLQGLPDMQER